MKPKYIWIKENGIYSPNQEPPNKVFEPTARGRHAFCRAKSRAGNTPVLDFPVENLRPCSRLNTSLVRREARYELVR